MTLQMQVIAHGAVEEIKLPFQVPKTALIGRAGIRYIFYAIAVLLGWIGYTWLAVMVSNALFGTNPERGSWGYTLSLGIIGLGFILLLMGLKRVIEAVQDARSLSRGQFVDPVVADLFAPWLVQQGFKDSRSLRQPESHTA